MLGPADLVPETRVDLEVKLGDVTMDLAMELEQLAPFGAGNPTPVLAASRALVVGARTVGRTGDHLKLTLRCPDTDVVHEAIGFGGGPVGIRAAGHRGASCLRHTPVRVAGAEAG